MQIRSPALASLIIVLWCAPAISAAKTPHRGSAEVPASASTATADSCLSNDRCRTLSDSGFELFRTGQLAAALIAYQEAYRIEPKLWIRLNMGRIQQRLGRLDEAIASFRAYLDGPEAEKTAEQVETARKYLAQAELDKTESNKPTPVETPARRPLWRFLLGGVLIAGGAAFLGGGGYALSKNGECVEPALPPARECVSVFTTVPMGAALTTVGSLSVVAGIITIAWPAGRRRAEATPSPAREVTAAN